MRRQQGEPQKSRMTSTTTISPPLVPGRPDPALEARIERGAKALLDQQRRTAIGCSSSRPTPRFRPNTCCCAIISASRSMPSWKRKIAVYLRRIQGAAWRLAAVPRRRLRHERQREGLFRAEDDRRLRRRRRTCGARARRSSRAAARRSSNVFTRVLLALYGVVPWRAVPVMPVEIMLLPRWFPFHLDRRSRIGRAP